MNASRRNKKPAATQPGRGESTLTDAQRHSLPDLAIAAAIGLFGAIWLMWFFTAQPVRLNLLRLLLVPEELVASWFGNFQQPLGLLDRWPLVVLATVILLASRELGRWLLKLSGLDKALTAVERTALSLGAGLNLVSLTTLAVGLSVGYGQRWWLALPLGLLAACNLARTIASLYRLQFRKDKSVSVKSERWSTDRVAIWGIGLCAAPLLMMLLGAMLPPWDFDVREYHLQVPKEWQQAGHVSFLPHNIYGNMPLGAELPAVAAMSLAPGDDNWWWGAMAGKLLMACYVPLTAMLLYSAGRRWFDAQVAVAAPVLYVSQPWVAHTAANGLNEPAVAFFTLAALYVGCLSRTTKSIALAGFFAGAAAACKYPAVVYIVAPLTVSVLALPQSSIQRRFLLAAAFLVGSSFGGGLWYAKNLALTGNPVYPLAYDLFGGATRTPEKNQQWTHAHQTPTDASGYKYTPRQLVSSLTQLLGRDPLVSPLLAPLLLIAAAFPLVQFWQRSRATRSDIGGAAQTDAVPPEPRYFRIGSLALLISITAVWWLATHRIERFWLPAVPLACIWAAYGFAALTNICHRFARVGLSVVLGVGFLYCVLAIATPLAGDNRWFVSLAVLREGEPTASQPARLSATHRWLNEHVDDPGAVLLVGDATPFDLRRPAFYNTCFDDSLLVNWIAGRSAAAAQQELLSHGIGFVYVDWREIRRYQSTGNYGYDPRFSPELIQRLLHANVLQPMFVEDQQGELQPVAHGASAPAARSNQLLRVNPTKLPLEP